MAMERSAAKMSRLFNVLYTQVRSYKGKRPPDSWKPDGVKYGLVTYYPRFPNHVDPPITPTKLLMVQRVKAYKGTPYWHRNILDQLFLNDKISDIAIVKNTPENCAMLWKIKHLIVVKPINTPERLPDSDRVETVLHENGDLLITPKIDEKRQKAHDDFVKYPKRLDRPYLNDVMRRMWLTGWENP